MLDHIASRQALANTTQRLLAVSATLDDAGLGVLGAELASVAGLLSREPGLRRTLSEATTVVDTRALILAQLLTGKVSGPTLTVVDFAVRQHWVSGADLRDAARQLGRTAMFLRAERTNQLDGVEDELFRFSRIVDASPDLSVLLDDPTTPGDARASLVTGLLKDRVHPLTRELLEDLARDTGGRSFRHGVLELVDQAAARTDKIIAVVESATEMTSVDLTRLTGALTRIYGRPVAVHVVVDPSLGGGIRVRVGEEVIDGTVSGRLAALRSKLAG